MFLYFPAAAVYAADVPRGAAREGGIKMFEYRVETYAVRKAEAEMNRMAADGWRVIAVCPNQGACYGIIVTYEKAR